MCTYGCYFIQLVSPSSTPSDCIRTLRVDVLAQTLLKEINECENVYFHVCRLKMMSSNVLYNLALNAFSD